LPDLGPWSPAGTRPVASVGALPLGRTAALVGEYRWIESTLYAMTGRWVVDMPVASAQVLLDSQSMHHAWHAELWAERLPVVAGLDPDALTRPSAAVAAVFEVLGDPGVGALPRLAGLYRVVIPRLVTTYTRHLGLLATVADRPVRRALDLVLRDTVDDWLAGEELVQRLVDRPADTSTVHGFAERLESVVVDAGARTGLVALPEQEAEPDPDGAEAPSDRGIGDRTA